MKIKIKLKTMNIYSAIGAGVAYLLVSLISGRLLPVLHIATIIAVVVGGLVGTFVGAFIEDEQSRNR